MKAEQRKEMETNSLADKMGVAMQKAKAASRRTVMFYIAVSAAVLVAVFFAYRYYDMGLVERSREWVEFYDGQSSQLVALAQKDDNAGKAAAFQIAWFTYWELGVKFLGHSQETGVQNIQKAMSTYKALQEKCADDPIFEPQAMLGYAVAQESLALTDPEMLQASLNSYEALVKKYEKSAEGVFAKKRAAILSDKDKRAEVANIYRELQFIIPGRPAIRDPHDKMTPEQREMMREMIEKFSKKQ